MNGFSVACLRREVWIDTDTSEAAGHRHPNTLFTEVCEQRRVWFRKHQSVCGRARPVEPGTNTLWNGRILDVVVAVPRFLHLLLWLCSWLLLARTAACRWS